MLTEKQIQKLKEKDWEVKPDGCYLELYKEDYCHSTWQEICSVLGNDSESNSVTVLIFGYNEN